MTTFALIFLLCSLALAGTYIYFIIKRIEKMQIEANFLASLICMNLVDGNSQHRELRELEFFVNYYYLEYLKHNKDYHHLVVNGKGQAFPAKPEYGPSGELSLYKFADFVRKEGRKRGIAVPSWSPKDITDRKPKEKS